MLRAPARFAGPPLCASSRACVFLPTSPGLQFVGLRWASRRRRGRDRYRWGTDAVLRYRMSSVPASSGVLYFVERGAGPPLVLLHGALLEGRMFEPVLEPLARHHRVIVPDLRGHGKSSGLAPSYAAGQLAADVSRLLGHLGVKSTAVLGYSQGGAVAQQLALDDPGRCKQLVLVCSYAFNGATFRERCEGHLTPWLIRLLGMKRLAALVVSRGLKRVGEARARGLAGLIAAQDEQAMVGVWKGALQFDSRSRLAEIRCPVLIVDGERDEAVPSRHAEELAAGIAGSRRVTVPGADHALIWTHADALAHAANEFLQSAPTG